MKRLWIALGILFLILLLSLIHSAFLKQVTDGMTQLLTQAESEYQAGDTGKARRLTQLARQKWDQAEVYLYLVLCHRESDAVLVLFTQAQHYLEQEEPGGEYSACNAALVTQIELLYEMEELSLKNLF